MPTKLTDVFKNYYVIPDYQRGYSWGDKQWREFLEDILGHPENKPHYMGVITLQEVQDQQDTFAVVDGQQRITTLLLLAAALVKQLYMCA